MGRIGPGGLVSMPVGWNTSMSKMDSLGRKEDGHQIMKFCVSVGSESPYCDNLQYKGPARERPCQWHGDTHHFAPVLKQEEVEALGDQIARVCNWESQWRQQVIIRWPIYARFDAGGSSEEMNSTWQGQADSSSPHSINNNMARRDMPSLPHQSGNENMMGRGMPLHTVCCGSMVMGFEGHAHKDNKRKGWHLRNRISTIDDEGMEVGEGTP